MQNIALNVFKVKIKDTRMTPIEIFALQTNTCTQINQWRRSGVFIVHVEHVLDLFPVLL